MITKENIEIIVRPYKDGLKTIWVKTVIDWVTYWTYWKYDEKKDNLDTIVQKLYSSLLK